MRPDDGSAEQVLDGGDAFERAALDELASLLLEARAVDVPGSDLPGVGTRPSRAEVDAALGRNQERLWQARRRLYEAALDYPSAAARLGVSTNQISNLVSTGELLALDGAAGRRLPAWQFHPDTPRGRLPGIPRIAAAFPGRILGLSDWMATPNPALSGRAPAVAVADGDLDAVVAVATAGW